MNELLKKLLEADILSEDTRKELEEAMSVQIQEAVEAAKLEATNQVRVELTEQWITERDALIEAIDDKVEEFLKEEFKELYEDVSAYRDLEADYAEHLVEAKTEMAEELQNDLAELVEKLDSFLEIRLNAEFEELKEEINESKKLQFGRKVFESFVTEYRKNFVNEDSTEAELREVREQYEEKAQQVKTLEESINLVERKLKMDKILAPLNGKTREIMETILKSVPTEGLEEAYKTFIGRVLKESGDNRSEKEKSVLAESKSKNAEKPKLSDAFLRTGDPIYESTKEEDGMDVSEKSRKVTESFKRLAGLE
jgi:flavodoxin